MEKARTFGKIIKGIADGGADAPSFAALLNRPGPDPRSSVLSNREKEVIECLIVIRRARAGA